MGLQEVKRVEGSLFDFFKDLTSESFNTLMQDYENSRSMARRYISTAEYDKEVNQLIKEKIKELEEIK